MFQNEYRQVNKNSKFIAEFGITSGYQSSITGSERNILVIYLQITKVI